MSHQPLRKADNVAEYYGITWVSSVVGADYHVRLTPALVMEFADLGTLDDLFHPDLYSLPYTLKWQLVQNVAAGMTVLRQNHIVHGDLQARNVLVFSTGTGDILAKVTDFGLSFRGSIGFNSKKSDFKGHTPL